jgi:NAD(P)-dependent dehydrogenase (short-subunit alcohol dehydrogenase family)
VSAAAQVVYVTGAGSGIGRLAAQRLADAGAHVAAIDVNEAGLADTARGRDGIHVFALDVTDTRAVEENVRSVEASLGPIDRAFVAAGILRTVRLVDQPTDEILRIMDVNYRGLVNAAKAVLPGMLARRRGDLVLFASMAGWAPAPLFGAYNASKHAVVAFSDVLAHEIRDTGVRLCCVCPPSVDTPMIAPANAPAKSLRHRVLSPISAAQVLDAIERDLARGRTFCFPDLRSEVSWRVRRFAPRLLWWFLERVEGV